MVKMGTKHEEFSFTIDTLWGGISNLMNKISNIEDTIDGGWPELVDKIVDPTVELQASGKSPQEYMRMLADFHLFLIRLYYRLKNNPEKREFNIIKKADTPSEEAFLIQNYDYEMFKWFNAQELGDRITNDYVIIPVEKLSDKQRRAFGSRAE